MKNVIQNKVRMGLMNKFRQSAKHRGLSKRNVRKHSLFLYAKLTANENTVIWNLDRKINLANSQLSISNGLDERDAFIADGVGLGIVPVPTINNKLAPANVDPIFYVEPSVFPGPAINGVTEAQSLAMLYNGLLKISSNQDIRLQDYPTATLRSVPETQAVAGNLFQFDYEDVIKSLDGGIVFAGGDSNQIEVQMKGGFYDAIAGIDGTRDNYALLILDGVKIKNGASKATRGELFKLLS